MEGRGLRSLGGSPDCPMRRWPSSHGAAGDSRSPAPAGVGAAALIACPPQALSRQPIDALRKRPAGRCRTADGCKFHGMYEVVMSRSSPSLSRRNRPLMATARRWRAARSQWFVMNAPLDLQHLEPGARILRCLDHRTPCQAGGPPMPCSTRTWWVRLPRWRQCATG